QAEDGIRCFHVTGVQTCALPILRVEEIEGLVAHWTFEDEGEDAQTAKDSAGGHDLKLHNMAGDAWTKGREGERALNLDGEDDFRSEERRGGGECDAELDSVDLQE